MFSSHSYWYFTKRALSLKYYFFKRNNCLVSNYFILSVLKLNSLWAYNQIWDLFLKRWKLYRFQTAVDTFHIINKVFGIFHNKIHEFIQPDVIDNLVNSAYVLCSNTISGLFKTYTIIGLQIPGCTNQLFGN